MLKNEIYALSCRAYYEEQGLVVDKTNGEFAHCPLPKGQGDAGYYLLHEHHQVQGLLQSEDVGRCCFFSGHVKQFLNNCEYFPWDYFELWELYDKWAGNSIRGKGIYINPETGALKRVTAKEAEKFGWIHVSTGKTCFYNPKTGMTAMLTSEEAKQKGWIHVAAGKATYRDPKTGKVKRLTVEEAEQKGWLPSNFKSITVVRLSDNKQFVFDSAKAAAKALGLHQGHLSSVCNGKRKQHKGYTAFFN